MGGDGAAVPSPRMGLSRGGGCPDPKQCQRVRDNAFHLEPAFTLLEILLAIALMGLLAAVLVTGSVNLLSDKPATPEAVFWQAVRQSRTAALTAEREVRLSFDPRQLAFVLDDGASPLALPVPTVRELTVDFLSAQPGQSSVLIGGELVDTKTMPAATFYPDGTCSAFRVQFRAGGAAHVLSIDPWTCAQVLPRVEANP
jgi:prepilin-type N-terminal cleavage/methylation domain-containing protein